MQLALAVRGLDPTTVLEVTLQMVVAPCETVNCTVPPVNAALFD
ncbi:MAG: hypothetical protein U0232_27160 [Thermomicrobiales bacterium]